MTSTQLARKIDAQGSHRGMRAVSDPLVPLGRTWALHTEVQQVLDAVVIVAAMLFAYELRVMIGTSVSLNPVLPLENYLWVFAVLLPAGPYALTRFGFYQQNTSFLRNTWVAVKAATATMLLVATIGYLFKEQVDFTSRVLMALFVGLATVMLVARKHAWRLYTRRAHTRRAHRRVVLLGAPSRNAKMAELIESHELRLGTLSLTTGFL
jgi:FlaA1/EpsC-like NDP-sugar epimerase